MHPAGMILAVDLTRKHMHSAMPNAPVVADRPAGRQPVRALRLVAAQALRRTADRLEPVPVPDCAVG